MALHYPPRRRWLPSQCQSCPIWSHPPLEPSLRPSLSTSRCNHPATPTPTAAADVVDDVVVVVAMDDADDDTVAVVIAAASAAASATAVVMTACWLIMQLLLLRLWLHLIPKARVNFALAHVGWAFAGEA